MLFVAEVMFARMPCFRGTGPDALPHYGSIPIAIVLPLIVECGERRATRELYCGRTQDE